MSGWNPDQYLKFAEERTRPCQELAARIGAERVRRIIDLGCGPGNSTRVLAARWPHAEITGLDSSPEMIAAARESALEVRWVLGDIAEWAAGGGGEFDIVFSNAALQWVRDHAAVFPRLFARVAAGGALAVQVPGNYDAPQHRLLREMAARPAWRRWCSGGMHDWHSHELDFYYDLLAPLAGRLDLWATEYAHILPGPEGIVEWYRGTGMRPYLEAISSLEERERFAAEFLEGVRGLYPARRDGRVLFPFRRNFVVAHGRLHSENAGC